MNISAGKDATSTPDIVWAEAVYTKQQVPEYSGNPFIEALPPIWDDADAIKAMTVTICATEEERVLPNIVRKHLIASIAKFNQPFDAQIELFHTVGLMLRQGYVGRNPLDRTFFPTMQANLATLTGSMSSSVATRQAADHRATQSVSLVGMSGVGKTRAINSILGTYEPQVVVHSKLTSGPLLMIKQIRFLKVTCPEGSVKTLCIECIREFDKALGTNYSEQHCGRAATADTLRIALARLAWLHGLGLLVIDEVQHLCFAVGHAADIMKNYFKLLADVMGVPVLAIGTLDARKILGADFQSGRRHSGLPEMLPLSLYDNDVESVPEADGETAGASNPERGMINPYFRMVCEQLFLAQFLQEPIVVDFEMLVVLHHLSQGIMGVLVKLFMLAQQRALFHEIERLTPALFREVYDDCFGLLHPHLERLRAGRPLDEVAFSSDLENFDTRVASTTRLLESKARRVATSQLQQTPSLSAEAPTPARPTTTHRRQTRGSDTKCKLVRLVREGEKNGLSAHDSLLAAGWVRSLGKEAQEA